MNIADRVKQEGTATSDAIYVLSGAAASGHLTFSDGFQVPTVGDAGGTLPWDNVPILVTAGSDWQIITATLQRDDSGVLSIINGVVRASSTGSALGLTGSAAVTLTVVPSYWSMGMVDFGIRTPVDDNDRYINKPRAATGGLMALGPRSSAHRKHGVAIGNNAYGHSPYELVLGCGDWPDGEGGASLHGTGLLQGKTTDATPTLLAAFDADGAIAFSDTINMDSGLYIVRGVLTAIDMGNFDTKVWDVAFCVLTAADYSTSAIVGTPSYVEAQESAGATAWAVAAVVDSGANGLSIQVTGEAAKNITWVFTYTRHYHIVYP